METKDTVRNIVVNNPSAKLLDFVKKMKAHKEETRRVLAQKEAIYFPKR